jgi:hypothetical protein
MALTFTPRFGHSMCAGSNDEHERAMGLDFAAIDAKMFSKFDVDTFHYDNCVAVANTTVCVQVNYARYMRLGQALRAASLVSRTLGGRCFTTWCYKLRPSARPRGSTTTAPSGHASGVRRRTAARARCTPSQICGGCYPTTSTTIRNAASGRA